MSGILSLNSALRRKLLAYFLTNEAANPYVRELARTLDVDATNLSREMARLAEQGLLVAEKHGNLKHFRLNKRYPYYRELRKMLQGYVGIVPELRSALRSLPGIKRAFLYGSYAKGTPVATSDIDLLIVGRVPSVALEQRLTPLEKRLGREINYTLVAESEARERLRAKDPFLSDIWEGAKLEVLP